MLKQAVISATALMACIGFASGAHASCSGGKDIKGSFGVNVVGPVVGGSTAEIYNGVLSADGKCGLKGTITGGIFGQPSVTQAITGSYSVPSNKQGTVTIQLPDSGTAIVFDIGLIKDGKASEVTGIASNGTAIATIDFVAIPKGKFSVASLSGTYVSTCTGAGNDGSGGLGNELAYVTFDGAGNVTVLALANDNGHFYSASISGTYTVSGTGAYTVQYPDPYSAYIAYGEIVGDGSELRGLDVQTTSGYGPYRSCVAKKQA